MCSLIFYLVLTEVSNLIKIIVNFVEIQYLYTSNNINIESYHKQLINSKIQMS